MPDFTVHQLNVFRMVARCLSYTKAAEALYLSQPAVSQQVKTLEQALGLPLFARSGRGIVLTPVGQELQRHVERLLALFAETTPVVREIQALERGSVLVGASNSAGTYVVPPLLGTFHARYSRIHVTLTVANRRSIEELLLNHQLDMAVMSLVEREKHFAVESLMPYELVVVAPPSHRLAGQAAPALRDLQLETFLLREHGSGTRLDTEQHFEQPGRALARQPGTGQYRGHQGGSRRWSGSGSVTLGCSCIRNCQWRPGQAGCRRFSVEAAMASCPPARTAAIAGGAGAQAAPLATYGW